MSEQKEIIVGGQAVIEGVMMRAPNSYAVAVRRPDGTIVSRAERLPSLSAKYPILKVPVLRGSAVLIHSMILGVKALNFSANIALGEENSEESGSGESQIQSLGAAGSIVTALIFNVLLFVVLPLLLTNFLFLYFGWGNATGRLLSPGLNGSLPWYEAILSWSRDWMKPVRPSISFNLVDGVIRMGVFLVMIWSFSKLKYESGVHRVQRVPQTETSGRIHTSAITVAVLPEAEEVDVKIEAKDLRIDTFCSSGPGGQSVNTTYSAVRLTHLPTGLVVSMQDEKSQIKNREKAMRILRSRLLELEMQKQQDAISAERRSQVGSGDRSEKIRTYNFKDNRVTDHRIGLTLHKLDLIMEGDLGDIVDAVVTHYQAEKLNRETERQVAFA